MHSTTENGLDLELQKSIGKALGGIPQGLFILTSAFEHRRRGVVVSFVQQASFDPPMVMVALGKDRDIVPVIHESHAFALNQISEEDKLVLKQFADRRRPGDDPFQLLESVRRATGSPILCRAMSFMDCRLVRHIDVEGDHDLYIGRILDGGVLTPGKASVRLRDNGFKY